MRDGAQEICLQLCLRGFVPELFLLADPCGECGDDKGHGQHRHKGRGIAVYGKIQLHVRIGEGVVDSDNAYY